MSQTYTIELKMRRDYGGGVTTVAHSLDLDQTVIDEFAGGNAFLVGHILTESISDLAKAINVETELVVHSPSQPQS